jgi:hypothetical protein
MYALLLYYDVLHHYLIDEYVRICLDL